MRNFFASEKRFLVNQILAIILAVASATPDTLPEQESDIEPPKNENYAVCDSPYFGSTQANNVPVNFLRMGPNSKYFIWAGAPEDIPISQVNLFCGSLNMQAAEIRSNLELLSIDMFLAQFAPPELIVSIGANDLVKEGRFVESDGTPLSFHAFAESQPNNKDNMEKCIVLSQHPDLQRYVYLDVPCDTLVTPMCMLKVNTPCYLSSPLSTYPVAGGFDYIGSTESRDYYVGLRQCPRSIAAAECEEKGYHLVDFNTGLSNNQLLFDTLQKWIGSNALFPRIAFWTGAKIGSSSTDGKVRYQFHTSGRFLDDLSLWPSLTWDVDEPSDSSFLGLEECVSARLYHEYSPSTDNRFYLSTSNCRLPHYPLCYKDKEQVVLRNITLSDSDDSTGRSGKSDKMKGRAVRRRECPITLEMGKLNLSSSYLSLNEILSLSDLSRKGILNSEDQRFALEPERPWLSEFIDAIFQVAKKAAPALFVPPEYLNIMHNLILLYYKSVDNFSDPPEKIMQIISEATALLQRCKDSVVPFAFVHAGDVPLTFNGLPIGPVRESIDAVYRYLDLPMESYWYTFLTAVGRCYGQAPDSKTTWLYNVLDSFSNHLIAIFKTKWVKRPAKLVDYGVIVGDIDLRKAVYSMKVCAIAGFAESKIVNLYPPKPLSIPGRSLVGTANSKLL